MADTARARNAANGAQDTALCELIEPLSDACPVRSYTSAAKPGTFRVGADPCVRPSQGARARAPLRLCPPLDSASVLQPKHPRRRPDGCTSGAMDIECAEEGRQGGNAWTTIPYLLKRKDLER
jgi:hypothetical protein